MATLEGQVV